MIAGRIGVSLPTSIRPPVSPTDSAIQPPVPYRPAPEAITVWLVEDDDLFRDTLKRLLDTVPEVDCQMAFQSCEEALAVLDRDFAPEVVLMDLGLPGMSGIEGIRHIKAVSPGSHLVVLSVHEDNEKIFEAICAGASGYLLKPSTTPRIVEAIQAARSGGASINPQIARKVLTMFSRLAVPHEDYGLTARETEILGLLVDGLTKQRIAEELFLSYHTVDMHVRNIYAKLQVHSRSGTIAKALKERLI